MLCLSVSADKTTLKLPWLLGLLGDRGIGYDENNYNLHDKLQDAIGRGQNPISILPSSLVQPKFLTISDPYIEILGSGTKITYDRFLSSIRSKEQEERRKQILATTSGAFVYIKHEQVGLLYTESMLLGCVPYNFILIFIVLV